MTKDEHDKFNDAQHALKTAIDRVMLGQTPEIFMELAILLAENGMKMAFGAAMQLVRSMEDPNSTPGQRMASFQLSFQEELNKALARISPGLSMKFNIAPSLDSEDGTTTTVAGNKTAH